VPFARVIVVAACGLAAASVAAGCHPQPPRTEPGREQALEYTALGSGHLLRTMSADGKYLALEDGSRWEILASDQFNSAEWQPDASMTVRPARDAVGGFNYELLNTTDDEGVLAKLLPRPK
jgi:hypothetical protein